MSRFISGPPSMTTSRCGTEQLVEQPARPRSAWAATCSTAATSRGSARARPARARQHRARQPRPRDPLGDPARQPPRRLPRWAREHADHPDVAAERDGLDAVLGLAAPPRPDRRAEADHVLGAPDAEPLGRAAGARARAGRWTAQPTAERRPPGRPISPTRPSTAASRLRDAPVAVPGRSADPSTFREAAVPTSSRGSPAPAAGPSRRRRGHRRVRRAGRADVLGDHALDRVDDVEEPDPAGVERLDALLVRRVEDRRVRSPPATAHPARQPHGRERLVVQGLELPASRAGVQSQAGAGVRHPVGPAQAERDRQPHVRRRALGDGGAVDELDHRVHHRLRVHHDVDRARTGRRTAGAPRSPPAPC